MYSKPVLPWQHGSAKKRDMTCPFYRQYLPLAPALDFLWFFDIYTFLVMCIRVIGFYGIFSEPICAPDKRTSTVCDLTEFPANLAEHFILLLVICEPKISFRSRWHKERFLFLSYSFFPAFSCCGRGCLSSAPLQVKYLLRSAIF